MNTKGDQIRIRIRLKTNFHLNLCIGVSGAPSSTKFQADDREKKCTHLKQSSESHTRAKKKDLIAHFGNYLYFC